jgi:hypothetical protein
MKALLRNRGQSACAVAQIFSLPYRRIVFCALATRWSSLDRIGLTEFGTNIELNSPAGCRRSQG